MARQPSFIHSGYSGFYIQRKSIAKSIDYI